MTTLIDILFWAAVAVCAASALLLAPGAWAALQDLRYQLRHAGGMSDFPDDSRESDE